MMKFVKNYIKIFFLYIFIAGSIAIAYQMMMLYIQHGHIATSLDTLIRYTQYNERGFYLFLIVENIGFVLYAIYMQRARDARADCQVQTVTLEELSHLWLTPERVEANRVKAESGNPYQEAVRRQEEARPVAMVFKYEHTHNFYRIYLEANLKRATREELEIIYQLLRTIEEDAYDLTSVASMHSADYEIRALKKSIGGGKVSSYEICGSVSLYDHTLRVARHMLELMEEDGSGVEKMEYAAGIIAAIAHDLGKMQAISSFSMAQSDKEMADHPHYKLSYTILQERFPEYEHLKKVLQAVENHHVAPTDASRITKLLVRADKSAREEETTEWYKKQKQLKEIEAVVIEIPTPKELEGGQSPTPVVDKPIEPKRDQKKPKTNSVVDKLGAFVEQAKDKADAEDASIPKEKKPEKPKQKKQSPADSNEKRKENKDKSKFSASFDFDFGAIEGDFKINLLKIMSEKVSSSVSAKQPDWVPMKSHVLIKYALMKEALAPFVTVTGEFPIDDYVKTLILKLVELGEADHINTDKGYYFSTFKYVERHGTSRFQVIPIKNTYFDISPQDAREMFRENGYRFEKFTIESYGGKEVF